MSLSGSQGKHKGIPQTMLVGHTLQGGAYVVEAPLGHGGMGQVFLASHAQIDVPVAIKQVRADEPLPPLVIEELDYLLHHKGTAVPPTQGDFPLSGGANTDRFLREALLMARMRHPALPLLYDYFFEHGYWYLVMEYVPGPTLDLYMREHTPLPPLEAMNYAMQICDVLNYLHEQNPPVIFRDLKPTNILLHPDGRLMLVDFGIARYFKEGQFNDTTDFGSLGYASPEQYEGSGQTDARSDLFSLGVIMHEMLSGQRPTRRSVALEQLATLHTLNPAISPALSGLVMVATRAEPMYRFQSARIFYRALERVRAVEERRAYRYHALMSEVSAVQSTPAFPWLISPPSSQGSISADLAREQEQHAQHMRMREQPQSTTPRADLAQEALAYQLNSIDESLKLRTLSSSLLAQNAPQPAMLPTLNLNDQAEAVEPSTISTSQQLPPLLPPTPQEPGLPPTPRKPGRLGKLILALCMLLILLSSSLLTYSYATSRVVPTQSQPKHLAAHSSTIIVQPTMSMYPGATWHTLPSLPSEEADNTALYVRDQQGRAFIYLTGGFRGSQTAPNYSQGLYRYAFASATWEKINVANFPKMGNNAAASDEQGHLFFTGGYSPDLGTISAHLYQYQPANNTLQTISVPSAFPLGFGGSMLADQHGHLYLSEGFLTPGDPAVQAGSGWYRYDLASGLWHTLAALPLGLGYVQLVQDQAGNILLLGGSRDAGQHQPALSIYRYDVLRNTWMQLSAPLLGPLSGAASCTDGQGHLVIVGGYDPAHNQTLQTVRQFNLASLTWQTLPSLPNGGSWLGTAACDGRGHVYITRGANNLNQPTSDFLELTLPQAG